MKTRTFIYTSLVILIAGFGIGVAAAQDDTLTAEDHLNQGITYTEAEAYEPAIEECNLAIELDPNLGEAYACRGMARILQISDASLSWCAVDLDRCFGPEGAERLESDRLAMRQGFDDLCQYFALVGNNADPEILDFIENISNQTRYTCSTTVAPDVPSAPSSDTTMSDEDHLNQGLVYAEDEEYEQAIEEYDLAIELNADLAAAYYNRGLAYAALGTDEQAIADYEQAIALYNETIELNPEDAVTYNGRGLVYAALGDYDQAIADYDVAIELDSDFADAYFNRALAYAAQGERGLARANIDLAIRADPEFADAYAYRGVTRLQETIDNLIESCGGNILLCNQRQLDRALPGLERALDDLCMYASLAGDDADPEILATIEDLELQTSHFCS